MGYENKIMRLLANSDEKIRKSLIKIWQTNQDEYLRLEKEFKNELLALNKYRREDFINIIEKSMFSKTWKKLTQEKRTQILDEIEPIFIYEKAFSDHLEKFDGIKCVFLETETTMVVYCNGMYAPMSEDGRDSLERLRFALRAPSITIRDNAELEKYAQENEKFPMWLNELTFLEPVLKDFWINKESKNLKIK